MRKEKQLKTQPIDTDQDSGVFYIHSSDQRAYKESQNFFNRCAKEFREKTKDETLPIRLFIDRRGDMLFAICEA